MVVRFPWSKIEAFKERVETIIEYILVHVGTNKEREGTTVKVKMYKQLVRTLQQTLIEQIILSGIYQ